MATTFLHTGDAHIDNSTHGTVNPDTGVNSAWESNQRTIRHLSEQAVARNAGAVIDCGDLTKDGRPSMQALLMLLDAYMPVIEARIPILLLDGNHHLTGVSPDHRTLIHVLAEMIRARGGIVHVVSEPRLVTLENGLQVAVLPWMSKNRVLARLDENDLSPADGDRRVAEYGLSTLEKLAGEADSSLPLIMASHVTVDDLRIDAVTNGFRRGSETELAHLFAEPVLPRRELEKLPFQYGALGHIHTPQSMGEKYWYAGSPNRLTFTDMPDEKGGNLVTIDGDGFTVERILTPARRMVGIDLEYPDFEDDLALLQPGDLVQLKLTTGEPETPREVKKTIAEKGAILAETKARPKPKETVERVSLPKRVDPVTALRTWAEHNPTGVGVDKLVAAAEQIDAEEKVNA
jgi:exonuclease SbcD